MIVEPIGLVESSRTQEIDDDWGAVTATITLDVEQFSSESLAGLSEPRGDVHQPGWSRELMASYWTRPEGSG